MLSSESAADAELLELMLKSAPGPFRFKVDKTFREPHINMAFERLLMRGWVVLVDVRCKADEYGMARFFRVSPEAVRWFECRMAGAPR